MRGATAVRKWEDFNLLLVNYQLIALASMLN
jgi:hypothetical protein